MIFCFLNQRVLELDEEDERRPAYLETINESVMQLAFHNLNPRLRKMYQTWLVIRISTAHCYCSTSTLVIQWLYNNNHFFPSYLSLGAQIDSMCEKSMHLRQLLGLPEKEMEEQQDETRK